MQWYNTSARVQVFISFVRKECRMFSQFVLIYSLCFKQGNLTTIFTTTRLFFSKHFWALCNTLPSIIPNMGSVWCYRNWIEVEGITMAPNYPVNLRWRVMYWLVRGFRVVNVARILHVWQIFVKKFRHFFRIKYPLGGLSYAADGKLAFNLVNKLNRSVK